MRAREIRYFEYACDGYHRNGGKCRTVELVRARDQADADSKITAHVDAATRLGWYQTPSRGWLCSQFLHRDDPRSRSFNPFVRI